MTPAEKTRLLAERVMGWNYWDFAGDYDGPTPMFAQAGEVVWFYGTKNYPIRSWSPLTNLAHAGEVLEAMRAKGWHAVMFCAASGRNYCDFYRDPTDQQGVSDGHESLSTAICHAALRTEGVKEEEL